MEPSEFIYNLRQRRHELGLSVRDLHVLMTWRGERLGVNPPKLISLYKWENCTRFPRDDRHLELWQAALSADNAADIERWKRCKQSVKRGRPRGKGSGKMTYPMPDSMREDLEREYGPDWRKVITNL